MKNVFIFFVLLLSLILSSCLVGCSRNDSSGSGGNDGNGDGSAPLPDGEKTDSPSNDADELGADGSVYEDAEAIKLTVGSYNIANGKLVKHDISKLAVDILEKKLDVVGLQEVDMNCNRSGSIDTVKLLSEYTGYKYYCFFKAIDFDSGEYGNAVLSKYPILSTESLPLETGGHEGRVLGHARIDANGRTVNFFVTHLSYESDEIRAAQFVKLHDVASKYDNVIITGDFNVSSLSEYNVLYGFDAVNRAERFVTTFPKKNTSIDNIIYSVSDFIFDEPGALVNNHSDHYMLYATCKMRPASLVRPETPITYSCSETKASLLCDGLLNTVTSIGEWDKNKDRAYIEIDLLRDYNLDKIRVINSISQTSVYKWKAFGTNDCDLPLSGWHELGGKTNDVPCGAEGYTLELSDEDRAHDIRYVRIIGTYSNKGSKYPIAEVFIYGNKSTSTFTDLSPSATFTDKNESIINAFNDGDIKTSANIGSWGSDTNGSYVEIELDSPAFLHAINVVTALDGRYKWCAYASSDNTAPISEWTRIAEKTDDSYATESGYTAYLSAPKKSVKYRYVRIYATESSASFSYFIREIRIFGITALRIEAE